MQTRAVQIVIQGRVQGVGFRAWLQHQAQLRGLSGWVRKRDGSVEAAIAGPGHAVEQMLAVCREGPSTAEVAAVEMVSETLEAPTGGFEVRPTA